MASWTVDGTQDPDTYTQDAEAVDTLTVDGTEVWGASDESDYLNLASHVPQDAMDLWHAKPDIRSAYATRTVDDSTYDNRSADLSTAIADASSNNEILDLGSGGTYEMETRVNATGTWGVIGDPANRPRIYYVGNDVPQLLLSNGCDTFVLEGLIFDITEDDPGMASYEATDVGLANIECNNEVWAEDVRLEGQRKRIQEDDGQPRDRFTWIIQCTDPAATAFMHRIELPDGGTAGAEGAGGNAIGWSADPPHVGYNVAKECHVEGFYDNGYYVANSEGQNIIWDCYAANCRAGNIRIGTYDTWANRDKVIGGTSEHRPDGDARGACLVQDHARGEAIGLECIVDNDSWSNAVQVRGFAEETVLWKVTVDTRSGDANPVRVGTKEPPDVDVGFRDVYWYNGTGHNRGVLLVGYGSENADAGTHRDDAQEFRLLSEGSDEVHIYDGSTLTIGNTVYDGGTYSAADLGCGDPLEDYNGLPDFYFDYDNPP